ncbi:hypothetical protein H5410_041667 [Solanum commersonii]|uniref:Uncharacterized protein n=1 Tax=Solanum commersonii TaxID=4109 RepID=A0A9J5XSJ1_SOLCO|nr:hypothetical protein H5410_041667 [Solanum commersonii]
MNTDEFTHVNETKNEEVEIDEEVDLDDTPTCPDINSTEVPFQEDNPPVGTSRPPIVLLTRGKTKEQRTLKSNVWKFC